MSQATPPEKGKETNEAPGDSQASDKPSKANIFFGFLKKYPILKWVFTIIVVYILKLIVFDGLYPLGLWMYDRTTDQIEKQRLQEEEEGEDIRNKPLPFD